MSERLREVQAISLVIALGLGASACGGQKHPISSKKQRFMTAKECFTNFWHDKDDQRQPMVTKEGTNFVVVDGRCNVPLESPRVGVYEEPAQHGQPEYEVINGEEYSVNCYTEGEVIQDIRGQESVSDIWLKIGILDNRRGFIPEVNVGYVDESKLPHC